MANQPRILAGRVAAITGGARGIGRATARALAEQGMKVAIGDLDLAVAEQTATELAAGAIALPLDVTDRESFSAFLDVVEERLGPLDVLVNNAGIMHVGRFLEEDDMTARRMVDINLHGVILGTKLALERMVPRNRGHVVNIASGAGKYGAPGGATYSATKHGVVGLTEAVLGEMQLVGADVRLSYVVPAIVNTELGSGLVQSRGVKALEPAEVGAAIVEALQRGTVDVWVPRSLKPITLLVSTMPRRLAQGIGRALRADRVLYGADAGVRRGYELRAARADPALASGERSPGATETSGSP